jgi:hypothetical protein
MGYYHDMQDDAEQKKEELSLGERIYELEGAWFMRIDRKCPGVALPKEIGRLIQGAVQAQVRAEKPGYEWVKGAIEKINCHKAVLYALNFLQTTDRAKPTYGFRLFDESEYKEFTPGDSAGIRNYAAEQLRNTLGVVQLASQHGSFVGHTFLAGIDQLGRVICFEKGGYSFPFRITTLDGVWRSKGMSSFAAAPLEQFQNGTERTVKIREEVETRSKG